jgi:hypothetical protein
MSLNMGQGAKSKANLKEAEMLVAICKYLIEQHNAHSGITILTTYVGQLILIRQIMQDEGVGMVEATTVDNFQGEENDIILLSLVRSNEEGVTGFLNVANRVVVALSRARKGFYCIGDVSMLSESAPRVWAPVVQLLALEGRIGDGIPLALDPIVYDDEGGELLGEDGAGGNNSNQADLGPSAIRRAGQGGYGDEHLHGNKRAAKGKAVGGKAKLRLIPEHLVRQSDGHRCKYARSPEDFDGWLHDQATILERVDKLNRRRGSGAQAVTAAGVNEVDAMVDAGGNGGGNAGGMLEMGWNEVGGGGGNWVAAADPTTGQQYWYHKYNRTTTWQDPSTFADPVQESQRASGNGFGDCNDYNNGDHGAGVAGGSGVQFVGAVRQECYDEGGPTVKKAKKEAKKQAKKEERREEKRKEKEARNRAKEDVKRAQAMKRQKKREKYEKRDAKRAEREGSQKEKRGSSYVRNSKGEEVKLPPGWRCLRNSSGRTYFRNKELDQKTYYHPITKRKTRRPGNRKEEGVKCTEEGEGSSSSGDDAFKDASKDIGAGKGWPAGGADTTQEVGDASGGDSSDKNCGDGLSADGPSAEDVEDNAGAGGNAGGSGHGGARHVTAVVPADAEDCVPLTSV